MLGAYSPCTPTVISFVSELMTDTTTLGPYLRRERERCGLALRTISENTKLSIGLLEGLEADDISRWPGGIFRRAFVRSYAQCVGLDPDDVIRRFEQQFPPEGADGDLAQGVLSARQAVVVRQFPHRAGPAAPAVSQRTRLLGAAADMTVAVIFAFGCAAAGSRLLWPVLLIACYYAAGVVATGTSPMVALLTTGFRPARPKEPPSSPAAMPLPLPSDAAAEEKLAERHAGARRIEERPVRRRGMQASVNS
jgi:hypothetical protein